MPSGGYSKKPPRFQSTPPVKAATDATIKDGGTSVFQSTPPVKAATEAKMIKDWLGKISIHAAREGGDTISECFVKRFPYFNPRRP